MIHLSAVAAIVTLAWAIWCVLSYRVQDGIVGKLIFSGIALASLALLCSPKQGQTGQLAASITLNLFFAAYAIRHAFLRCAWGWLSRTRLNRATPPRRRAGDE